MRTLTIFLLSLLMQFGANAQQLRLSAAYSIQPAPPTTISLLLPRESSQDRRHAAKVMAMGGVFAVGGYLLARDGSTRRARIGKGGVETGCGAAAMVIGTALLAIGTVQLIVNVADHTALFLDGSKGQGGLVYNF